jgi:signal transduction histidine kinase
MVQVFYNLLTNAAEAISVMQEQNDRTAPHTITVKTFSEKDRVWILVEDTGIGIGENFLDRVFEPFYTTKELGKGKGLGLTICKQIVRDCNGRIAITSSPGHGTTVTIRFPIPG